MARRADVTVPEMSVPVSSDEGFLNRGRRLRLDAVEKMLSVIGCNLADLVEELGLKPTFGSWRGVYKLERSLRQTFGRHNRLFERAAARLDIIRLENPGKVIAVIERMLPSLAGQTVIAAAVILGPALRANRESGKAVAVLRWAFESEQASQALKACALRWLAYALASEGRLSDALKAALEAQDLHRLLGDSEQAMRGEIDKAILRNLLGDRESSRRGFELALAAERQLDPRSTVAALHGLVINAIEAEDATLASALLQKIAPLEKKLPGVDLGKIRWGQGRLYLILGQSKESEEAFLESSKILAECKSEDALKVFVEMLLRVRPSFDDCTLSTLAYSRARTRRDVKLVDQLVRAYQAANFDRLHQILRGMGGVPFRYEVRTPGRAIEVRKVLLQMARRAGVPTHVVTAAASKDRMVLYRRRRLYLCSVEAMLKVLGCNLADLVYELDIHPTYGGWEIVRILERAFNQPVGRFNRQFACMASELDHLRLEAPQRVVSLLEEMLPGLAGLAVFEAAVILGPALRANRDSGKAVAVLQWVVDSDQAPKFLKARALRWLAYALASKGCLTKALQSALEAQDLHRLLGAAQQVTRGEIEKAIIRHLLGDLENARKGFALALSAKNELDPRSMAAAFHGLVINAIAAQDAALATEAIQHVTAFEGKLPSVDLGKIRWGQGRLCILLGRQEEAIESLLESSKILADCKSEDAIKVFLEMLVFLEVEWRVEPREFTLLVYQRAKTPRGVRLADQLARLYKAGCLTLPRLKAIYRQIGGPDFTSLGLHPVL